MDDENLRVRAMDFAIAARTSQHEDIVELAQRIYAFLNEDDVPLKDALAYAGDIVGNMPPPIPQQDLAKADQSPKFFVMQADDDTPTRIVRLGA